MSATTSGNMSKRTNTILNIIFLGGLFGFLILLLVLSYGVLSLNWFGFNTGDSQRVLAYENTFKLEMAQELEVGSQLQNVTVENYVSKPYGYYYLFIKLNNGQPARAMCVFQATNSTQPRLWCSPTVIPFPSPIN